MIDKIKLNNFKCFSELELELRPLTMLCGVNSGGKSSVIQALLMGMESAEDEKDRGNLDLMNGRYNIDLYSFRELLYEDAVEDLIRLEIVRGEHALVLEYTSSEGDNNLCYRIKEGDPGAFAGKKIWYLGSERMISKYQKRGNAEQLELGRENEYIAFILERGRSQKLAIDRDRNCQDAENSLFSTQVNQWLDYILPGSQVMAATTGNDNMVSLNFGKDLRLHRTNVGYGVGFVLPIIVGGLLAQKGDLLVIENPELHLHPRAQSDLGIFFSVVAKAGVQVFIETHSDHIVNGIRRAVVDPAYGLGAGDVGIYYFNMDNQAEFLELDQDASLSDWPEDFMEQTDKDLYYLRKMRLKNGNKGSGQ